MEDSTTFELKLPGFRFHPNEEELLSFYLKNMVFQKEPRVDVIGFLNIYHYEPWELPGMAKINIGEREWYFFVPRDRRNGRQGRPNRTTENGFWKATGSERKVISLSNPKKMIGLKKTLVFYKGRAPRGCRTDWVMNEFRLPDTSTSPTDLVLCKVYRKATSLKVLEQRAAMEEETSKISPLFPITPTSSSSSSMEDNLDHQDSMAGVLQMALKKNDEEQVVVEEERGLFLVGNQNKKNEETTRITENISTSSIQLPIGQEKLADLLVPKSSVDWTQDQFWAQLPSPWLDNLAFYANALNS